MADTQFEFSRYEGARNQLNTAIHLWFEDGDLVSVHMLAYHAHEMIHQIFRRKDSDLLFDTSAIPESERAEFCRALKAPANFFKHANDKDDLDDESLKTVIDPIDTLAFMIVSIGALQRMQHPLTPHEAALVFWVLINHPAWFAKELGEFVLQMPAIENVRGYSKDRFLESFLLTVKKNPAIIEKSIGGLCN